MPRSLTREQVRRVDAIAINELGIPGVVLMENAGRNAAECILGLRRRHDAARIAVFCGPGNNGGDGFVIARHLINRGVQTRVLLAGDNGKLTEDAGTNYGILRAMDVPVVSADTPGAVARAVAQIHESDIVVDALLGTGFRGDVREPLATLIDGINRGPQAAVVAIDVPSGLDCNTGRPAKATVRATCTITFVANKAGFAAPEARPYTGEVIVADIGAPPDLIDRVADA